MTPAEAEAETILFNSYAASHRETRALLQTLEYSADLVSLTVIVHSQSRSTSLVSYPHQPYPFHHIANRRWRNIRRIEIAIQRFVDRRRMTNDRSALFSKYLALGGIDTTRRQFNGTAKLVQDWKDDGFTKDEIRGFTANDFIGRGGDPMDKFYNPDHPEHWDVDFAGVVAGFL